MYHKRNRHRTWTSHYCAHSKPDDNAAAKAEAPHSEAIVFKEQGPLTSALLLQSRPKHQCVL